MNSLKDKNFRKRNRVVRTFPTEYFMFSNQNHFRIHKQVSESATYSFLTAGAPRRVGAAIWHYN